MADNGANPMRWDCNRGGAGENCFNVWKRPKLAVFADCFPGKINFGDIDGCAEMGSKRVASALALLEWKGVGAQLQDAQAIMFRNITLDGVSIAFVVEGCAKEMTVERWCIYWNGKKHPWQIGGMEALKARIRKWADWAEWRRYPTPDRVWHKRHGAGTTIRRVMAAGADGPRPSLVIDFDRAGTRVIRIDDKALTLRGDGGPTVRGMNA